MNTSAPTSIPAPRRRTAACLGAVVTVLITAVAASGIAPSGGTYDVDWFTTDGGGGISSGGTYTLSGTIGQPDAGAMSGGGFELAGGFWAGVPGDAPPTCVADLNGSGTVDASDLAVLLSAWNTPGADLDGDETTNASDLAILLGAWGPCPL